MSLLGKPYTATLELICLTLVGGKIDEIIVLPPIRGRNIRFTPLTRQLVQLPYPHPRRKSPCGSTPYKNRAPYDFNIGWLIE